MVVCSAVLLLLAMAGQTMAADPLITAGSTWKYLDDGSNQGTAWREIIFDDDSWASGPAELGYGDGDEATVVSYGPDDQNKYITTYFRQSFEVTDASLYERVTISLKRDDGIVVYLNGTEILRDSMPTGTITYTTLATQNLEDNYFRNWTKDVPNLVNGTNVLAVEIHQYSADNADISFDLSMDLPPVDMRKGPYLIYPGNNAEMMVLWQLEAPTSLVLRWGQDTSCSEGTATPTRYGDTQYRHTITGLTPGVKYYYKVERASGGSFFAAPADDAANIKFLAFGDTRTNPDTHDAVNAAMINAYSSDPTYQTFTMLSGDYVNSGDSESDWTGQFFDRSLTSVQEMHANLPTNGCIGNHESSGSLFDKYWPYPYESGGRWWSFDYGPAHVAVIVLTSEPSGTLGAAQKAWLEADLAASTKEWKFLQYHAPTYSASGSHVNNTAEQAYIQNLCIEYNVDMVFNGHNHYYSHCDVDGVKYITTGGGGAPFNTPNPNYHESIRVVSRTNHFCKIDIQGSELFFEAVNTSGGAVIDSFTLVHINDTTAPTPDPMTWESLPEGTSYDRISMTASTASDDYYDVEYYFECTAGPGHDRGWQVGTTYVDMGLDPGTQYSYRVKARDTSRRYNETGFSSEESATTHPPDLLAPRPDPTTWAAHPESGGINSILMAVVPATDPAGVEYYFQCTAGSGGSDSGWQDSDVYEDRGLLENIVYTYRVKARDKSPNQNETNWSHEMSARTDMDFPNPGDFNRDGFVDFLDAGLLGLQFGRNGCGLNTFWCNFADMDQSTGVDATDLWLFCSHWLEEYIPEEIEMAFDDFDSYASGTRVRDLPNWYTGGWSGGVVVQSGIGIGGSQGCTGDRSLFSWSAGDGSINTFNWSELATGDAVVMSMDFEFANDFEDESVGWTRRYNSTSSSYFFRVRLDDISSGGYGIEGGWTRESGGTNYMTIASIPSPTVDAWYRLRAVFTKLTATSLSIDVEVWLLDAAGEQVSLFATGSVPDTSTLGNNVPQSEFFTSDLWPAFMNDRGNPGACDNAYYGFMPASK